MRLEAGGAAPPFQAEAVGGRSIRLETFAGKWLWLMFFRYASCPMCNVRLHQVAQALPALQGRGLEAVAFFHSSSKRVRAHAGARHYPLQLVGDRALTAYRAFGVESSWPRLIWSAFLPRFYADWMRALRHGFWGGFDLRMAGLPADFLVGPDGRIALVHYGRDIGDHLSIDRVEAAIDSGVY